MASSTSSNPKQLELFTFPESAEDTARKLEKLKIARKIAEKFAKEADRKNGKRTLAIINMFETKKLSALISTSSFFAKKMLRL